MNIREQKHLSEEFIKKLSELAAGYLPAETFDNLAALFQAETSKHFFTRSSESNLLRIIAAMLDKYSFLNDCLKYPHYVEIMTAISSSSNYLTDILVRNPEYLYWIVNPSNLEPILNLPDFEKSVNLSLNQYKNFSTKVNYFRSLKRKEILRIGLKDILSFTSLEAVTEELSTLAKGIAAKLFELSLEEIKSKYQIKNLTSSYCLIGLGKLGGNELNYSSDIDLIIFYDDNQKIKNKFYHEILTEAIHLFIESASSITSSGFIFRVDFRLRPDGRNSPLCRSMNEYLSYYESRGEDWERQMLIKAGFVGGNYRLYQKFITYLTPFIYPSSFSISPTEQIKKLKNNIERNLKDETNIKLLPGGIRDIEFSVQALQLINGGKWKDLQTGNTLKAVTILRNKKLLTNDEAEIFTGAYHLYRKIEHYLQLMNDKQTHSIPKEGEQLNKMSSYLGFPDSKKFKDTLHENRRTVTKIYQSIMGKEIKVKAKIDISEINFENKKKAQQDFIFLREGKGLLGQKEFDERTISAFQIIEADIIYYLKNAVNPDSALQNFVRIIKHSNIPFIWYKELTDKKLLTSLLAVCEFAQRTIDLCAEDSEVVELFLNRKVFEKIDHKTIEQHSLKSIVFTLEVQFILGISDHVKVSKTMSQFCKAEIQRIFNESFINSYPKLEYFAAGLGSFSIEEMTLNSDIDLVFVVRDLKILPNAEKIFQDILEKIRKSLFPIAVDCRLRPEGKSSLLVSDIKNYDTYIQKRLRVWELQAFTKISLVCGNENLFAEFLETLQTRLAMESKSLIANEIKEMRKKLSPANIGERNHLLNIRKSLGGLVDSDFVLQYLALTSGMAFSKFAGKGLKLTSVLLKKYFAENDTNDLNKSFLFLKRLDLLNQIMFNVSTAILPSDKKKLAMLAKKMDCESAEMLRQSLNEVMKSNKLLFQKYVVAN